MRSAKTDVRFVPIADFSNGLEDTYKLKSCCFDYLFRSSRLASVLLPPLRPGSAHVVSFWPVRDEYGHEHSSNQSRPRTVARPIKFLSFEPHVETLTLLMSDLAHHSPAVSLLFKAFMASHTQVAVFAVTKSPTANKTYV